MEQPCKATLRQESQAEELDEILGLYDLQSDFLRNQFFASAKENVPDSEDNAVIAVVFAAQRRVMRAVKGRRYHDIGKPFLPGKGRVRMMEKHEEHA